MSIYFIFLFAFMVNRIEEKAATVHAKSHIQNQSQKHYIKKQHDNTVILNKIKKKIVYLIKSFQIALVFSFSLKSR